MIENYIVAIIIDAIIEPLPGFQSSMFTHNIIGQMVARGTMCVCLCSKSNQASCITL